MLSNMVFYHIKQRSSTNSGSAHHFKKTRSCDTKDIRVVLRNEHQALYTDDRHVILQFIQYLHILLHHVLHVLFIKNKRVAYKASVLLCM